jgi:zona occludens toxin
MFHLITGTPGSGKTLSTIDTLRKITDRPIFYFGIPELNLPWTKVTDPKNYHTELPDGSIFVLDECQQHFPVRAPSAKVPDAISFIETHRHRGIDIYFITQHPNLLDHHARRLVGHHTHLQRNFGFKFAVKYTNNKLFDATNYHELQTCTQSQYKYPKDVFNLYKSAEVHTHKAKFPKKLLFLIPLLILVGFGIYTVYNMLHKRNIPLLPSQHQLSDGTQSTNIDTTINQEKREINWTTAYIPVLPGVPHTAPLYKDIAVPTTMPIVSGCVYSKKRDKCACYTQQATIIDMSKEFCMINVKLKSFNPFKAAPKERIAYDEQPAKVAKQPQELELNPFQQVGALIPNS